jgi:co-chaperonin GroES (HSP10)
MTAAVLRNDEYYDFAGFKEFALQIANEMPEKTKPLGDQIALAMFIKPEKTRSGIYMASKTQDESRWQEPLGVLIAKGATAFKYDGAYEWQGYVPEIGDVLSTLPSDSRGMYYRGLFVRIMPSSLLKMVVDDSDTESFY